MQLRHTFQLCQFHSGTNQFNPVAIVKTVISKYQQHQLSHWNWKQISIFINVNCILFENIYMWFVGDMWTVSTYIVKLYKLLETVTQ